MAAVAQAAQVQIPVYRNVDLSEITYPCVRDQWVERKVAGMTAREYGYGAYNHRGDCLRALPEGEYTDDVAYLQSVAKNWEEAFAAGKSWGESVRIDLFKSRLDIIFNRRMETDSYHIEQTAQSFLLDTKHGYAESQQEAWVQGAAEALMPRI